MEAGGYEHRRNYERRACSLRIGLMPAVFVHGSPETHEVWAALRSGIRSQETVALSMPGFGCPRTSGFGASKEDYLEWLVRELERMGEPVDLVGHDWGGILAVRAAAVRGELVQSWASDALDAFHERFQWHRWAEIWQTPQAGEAWVEKNLRTTLSARTAAFERMLVPTHLAPTVAGWLDSGMGESMLALYRSAGDIATTWSRDVQRIDAPGLAIHATADEFCNDDLFTQTAKMAGAQVIELKGLGHWWMLQSPTLGARTLETFWGSLR